jgi:hypothetical protein
MSGVRLCSSVFEAQLIRLIVSITYRNYLDIEIMLIIFESQRVSRLTNRVRFLAHLVNKPS